GSRHRSPVAPGRSALVIAARQALLATFLVDEGRLPALLAEIADAALIVGARHGRSLGRRLELARVLGQRARERVRQREHLALAEAQWLGAADAGELADDLLEPPLRRHRRRQPETERNQPAQRFRHRHGVRAALADLYEDLEGLPVLRLVHGDEGRADRGLAAIRPAREAVRARLDDGRPRRGRRRGLVLHAHVEHLLALAAVAEDRDAEAPELPRQLVGRRHVVLAGVVGQVDRLAHAVVGVALEGRLVPHVPLVGDVVRRLEDALGLLGHARNAVQRAAAGDLL